ncbi:MAG: hypothetical protein AAFZ15_17810 [Bacteroidota bacterium]
MFVKLAPESAYRPLSAVWGMRGQFAFGFSFPPCITGIRFAPIDGGGGLFLIRYIYSF